MVRPLTPIAEQAQDGATAPTPHTALARLVSDSRPTLPPPPHRVLDVGDLLREGRQLGGVVQVVAPVDALASGECGVAVAGHPQ